MILGITGCPGSGKSILAGIMVKQGWVLVRPSGTEPVIRITCEGPTDEIVKNILQSAEEVVKTTIASA